MYPDTATNWRRLYAAAAVAGGGLGLLVALGALPAIPHQVATWLGSFDDTMVARLVSTIGGALIGLALAAVAHLGVTWQLRRSRSGPK
jgi:hypothetical protein